MDGKVDGGEFSGMIEVLNLNLNDRSSSIENLNWQL